MRGLSDNGADRIGVFGGSFDPVHTGHLTIAQDAVEQLELDRLIFMPASVQPFKQGCAASGAVHRLEMLRLATESNPVFEVSDLEILRGGLSYTVDTLMQLQEEHPGAAFFFIIGLDSLIELHRWRHIEKLLEICTVVPFARGGEDPVTVAEKCQLPEPWKTRLLERMIRIHQIEISSSEIRMRTSEGLSTRYLVPPEVEMYIAEHHLYG